MLPNQVPAMSGEGLTPIGVKVIPANTSTVLTFRSTTGLRCQRLLIDVPDYAGTAWVRLDAAAVAATDAAARRIDGVNQGLDIGRDRPVLFTTVAIISSVTLILDGTIGTKNATILAWAAETSNA